MIVKIILFLVLVACIWGVLDSRIPTRILGTMALSMIAILAAVGLC